MKRIIRLISAYVSVQFDLSIIHQINLAVLLCFIIYMATLLTRSPSLTFQHVCTEAVVFVREHVPR